MHLTRDVLERFESKFQRGNDSDCWIWKGSKCSKGYGHFSMRQSGVEIKTYSAHRISWAIENNSIIPEKMMICHTCDNPSCVNPNHLYLGTGFDNNKDTVNRGRANRKSGNDCSWSKLTENDVLDIRSSNDSQTSLAKKYGVSQPHISRIISGDRSLWKHAKKA